MTLLAGRSLGAIGAGERQHRITVIADTGCSIAPRCLQCPLERCRYDEPIQSGRMPIAAVVAVRTRILQLHDEGKSPGMIATLTGQTRHSVYRHLAKALPVENRPAKPRPKE